VCWDIAVATRCGLGRAAEAACIGQLEAVAQLANVEWLVHLERRLLNHFCSNRAGSTLPGSDKKVTKNGFHKMT
jgi:hypothetical protein